MATPDPATAGADRVGHTIKRAEQALIGRKSHALREFGLTVPQYVALFLLATTDGMSAAELARRAMVSPQTMATVLGNLLAKGLIARETSSLHRRVLVTTVTPAGRELLAKADDAALRVERELAGEFSSAELDRLRVLLERAIRVLGAEEPSTLSGSLHQQG